MPCRFSRPVPADTIAAIATAPGEGAVGVVRLSGPLCKEILKTIFRPSSRHFQDFIPRTLHHGHIVDSEGRAVDEVLAVFFPGPHSFTGEDAAEIQGHGGPAVLRAVLETVLDHGSRLEAETRGVVRQAERGEFTRRAFINGRMDLARAEAVAELVAAPCPEGARLALAKLEGLLGKKVQELRDRLEQARQRVCLAVDFPEEEAECLPPDLFLTEIREVADGVRALLAGYQRARCWREGALVVLAGPVNAGKSSLMNALLGRPRALVADVPGTTRDYLEESTTFDGLPVRLMDTAGLRDDEYAEADAVEQEGIRRGREMMETAQAVLVVLDGARAAEHSRTDEFFAAEFALIRRLGPDRCVAVWNKADVIPSPGCLQGLPEETPLVEVSARTGQGLESLVRTAVRVCNAAPPQTGDMAPNLRQARCLEKALTELQALEDDIMAGMPPDLCGLRLEGAVSHLADITGLNSAEETLNAIFADFCIGK